jgi:hypothetical protein
MNLDPDIGLLVLALAILVGAALVGLVVRFARRTDSLVEAMAHSAFLPEKRRRYLTLLSLEGVLLLDTAIVWSLALTGIVPDPIGTMVIAIFLVGGMASILGLTWIGLRPTRLTEANRAELRKAAPQILESLFLAPYAGLGESSAFDPSADLSSRRRRRRGPGTGDRTGAPAH